MILNYKLLNLLDDLNDLNDLGDFKSYLQFLPCCEDKSYSTNAPIKPK